ncbi:MAG: hypothetical protein ISS90_00020 [Candidatus Omnitrophica bacterium]|nr:hypothetical protein [Candidatus Omnitrophota bacterium]
MIEKIKTLYLNDKCTVKEVADELGLSFWKVYNMMRVNNIHRRGPSETNYLQYDRYKPRFVIKEDCDPKNKYLKVAGLMLYWAEGAKGGDTVDFANSDSGMIKIFLRFLREVCGIAESRLRIYLYAFSDQNIDGLKRYWSEATGIPLQQFTKPYVKNMDNALKDRRMPHGMIHVRYHDKRLLKHIKHWISEYAELFDKGEMPE